MPFSMENPKDIVLKTTIDFLMDRSIKVCKEAGSLIGSNISPVIILVSNDTEMPKMVMETEVDLPTLRDSLARTIDQIDERIAADLHRIAAGEKPCPKCGMFHDKSGMDRHDSAK